MENDPDPTTDFLSRAVGVILIAAGAVWIAVFLGRMF